jgi:hypothetical protein
MYTTKITLGNGAYGYLLLMRSVRYMFMLVTLLMLAVYSSERTIVFRSGRRMHASHVGSPFTWNRASELTLVPFHEKTVSSLVLPSTVQFRNVIVRRLTPCTRGQYSHF